MCASIRIRRLHGPLVGVVSSLTIPWCYFAQDHRVDVDDISATLTSLRHSWKAEEVRNMLWEVDDDGRGYLSLRRFQQVYYRVRARWDFVVPHRWMV